MSQYRVLIKKHNAVEVQDWMKSTDYITIFYDPDRNECIKAMKDYDKSHGFSFEEIKDGKKRQFSCADILLIEESHKGEVLSVTTFNEIV